MQKETALTRGIRMLWPHISKDLTNIPSDKLEGMMRTLHVMIGRIIEPHPTVPFDEYMQQSVNESTGP